jgi:hypothetical protein
MDARYKPSGMATLSVMPAVAAVHPSEAASKDLDSERWIPAFAPPRQSASARKRGNDSVEENFWVFVIPAGCGGDPSWLIRHPRGWWRGSIRKRARWMPDDKCRE